MPRRASAAQACEDDCVGPFASITLTAPDGTVHTVTYTGVDPVIAPGTAEYRKAKRAADNRASAAKSRYLATLRKAAQDAENEALRARVAELEQQLRGLRAASSAGDPSVPAESSDEASSTAPSEELPVGRPLRHGKGKAAVAGKAACAVAAHAAGESLPSSAPARPLFPLLPRRSLLAWIVGLVVLLNTSLLIASPGKDAAAVGAGAGAGADFHTLLDSSGLWWDRLATDADGEGGAEPQCDESPFAGSAGGGAGTGEEWNRSDGAEVPLLPSHAARAALEDVDGDDEDEEDEEEEEEEGEAGGLRLGGSRGWPLKGLAVPRLGRKADQPAPRVTRSRAAAAAGHATAPLPAPAFAGRKRSGSWSSVSAAAARVFPPAAHSPARTGAAAPAALAASPSPAAAMEAVAAALGVRDKLPPAASPLHARMVALGARALAAADGASGASAPRVHAAVSAARSLLPAAPLSPLAFAPLPAPAASPAPAFGAPSALSLGFSAPSLSASSPCLLSPSFLPSSPAFARSLSPGLSPDLPPFDGGALQLPELCLSPGASPVPPGFASPLEGFTSAAGPLPPPHEDAGFSLEAGFDRALACAGSADAMRLSPASPTFSEGFGSALHKPAPHPRAARAAAAPLPFLSAIALLGAGAVAASHAMPAAEGAGAEWPVDLGQDRRKRAREAADVSS